MAPVKEGLVNRTTVESLFQPYRHMDGDLPVDGLTCLTYVIPQHVEHLRLFGERTLVAATGAHTLLWYPPDLEYFLGRINLAIQHRGLFGPKQVLTREVRDPEDLCQLVGDGWRVDLIPNTDPPKARVIRKHELRTRLTPVGVLSQLALDGVQVLQLLTHTLGDQPLRLVAEEISRQLGLGMSELVMVNHHGELLYPATENVTATIAPSDRFRVLNLVVRTHPVKLETWHRVAVQIVGGKATRITPLKDGEREGRIPNVLPADRLITRLDAVGGRGLNRVVAELTGIHETPLMYGASDIGGNVIELLQLMVACERTGRPGVFNIELRAHNIGDYWDRILGWSLRVIGSWARLMPELRMSRADHMTGTDLFASLNITLPSPLDSLAHMPLGEFYLKVHQYLVRRINELLGLSVRVQIVEVEKLFAKAADHLTIGEAVDLIEAELGHRVLANHYHPSGRLTQITTNQVPDALRYLGISDYLAGAEAWPGGALTYLLLGAVAHHGPVVFNLKDSRLGNVAQAAIVSIPRLGGLNHAQFVVSGVTRCYPEGSAATTGDNIDPVVFAIMLDRYPEEMKRLLRAMMNRWLLPVTPKSSGVVQVYTLGQEAQWYMTRYLDSAGGKRP